MKILLLSTRFYPHVGGVENVVENLASEFSRDGHEVVVLTSNTGGIFNIEQPLETRGDYKVKRIWMAIPRSIMGYVVFPFRFVASVYKLTHFINGFKPDIINFHFMDDASLYVWITRLFCKKPVIVNIHGNDIQIFAHKPFYKIFINSILNSTNTIIVNSDYMRSVVRDYSQSFYEKARIVANGLNVRSIKNISPKKFVSDPYIFYVGRLVHKKGVDVLIQAFKKADIKKLKLVIEGTGEESFHIRRLIKDLDIEDKIIMTEGKSSYEEMISYMKAAVFGVMPSRVEPFGIVSLEFLAAGIPLVASKTGGLINILEDGQTCLFFENENIDDLTDKIKTIYSNAGLRMKLSVNGLERAQDFSWQKIACKYIKIFNDSIHKS